MKRRAPTTTGESLVISAGRRGVLAGSRLCHDRGHDARVPIGGRAAACEALVMAGPLVVCPACSTHVLVRESSCPHCGAKVRSGGRLLGRTAGACLMGLSLAGCPAGDDTSETMAGSGSSSTDGSTGSTTNNGSTTDDGTTSFDVSSGPVGEAYGAPDTETFGTDPTDSTSTGGDTDTEGTGGDTDTEGTTGTGSSSSTSG